MKKNISPTRISLILIAIALFAVFGAGCEKKIKRQRANIILVTLDTVRADHIGAYGYDYIETPNIDGLAADGVLFEKAFASVPLTLPSHASILTGLYPPAHGVRENNSFYLPGEITTLAEILKQNGYSTGAIVAAAVLGKRFGLNKGFDIYDDSGMDRISDIQFVRERKANIVTDRALEWLSMQNGKNPYFLWLHYYDPHFEYAPPKPFADKYSSSPYNGEIAFVDSELKAVFERARRTSTEFPTAIILTADHGESLADHGEFSHGYFIYNSTMLVPLIISAPDLMSKNKRIGNFVSNVSIAPTILDLIGIPKPAWMQTASLLKYLEDDKYADEAPIYTETYMPFYSYGFSPLKGIIQRGYYYIEAPKPELYDNEKDFDQEENLYGEKTEIAYRMKKSLAQLLKNISKSHYQQIAKAANIALDIRDQMNALGYISLHGDETATDEASIANLIDPKDRIGLYGKLSKISELISAEKYAEAIAMTESLMKDDPDNPTLLTMYSRLLKTIGKNEEAKNFILNNILAKHPNEPEALILLGTIDSEAGRLEEAKSTLLLAHEIVPSNIAPLQYIAEIYIKQGDAAKAEEYLWKAMEISKTNSITLKMLESILAPAGKTNKIITVLEESLAASPFDTDIMTRLASIKMENNKQNEAIELFKRVVALNPRDPASHYNLAVAISRWTAAKRVDYEEAIKQVDKTIELDPNFTKAEDAKKLKSALEALLPNDSAPRR